MMWRDLAVNLVFGAAVAVPFLLPLIAAMWDARRHD